MQQLEHLIALKRDSGYFDGFERYFGQLYSDTAGWVDNGTPLDTATLIIDAIVDRAAHEDLQGPQTGQHVAAGNPARSADPEGSDGRTA